MKHNENQNEESCLSQAKRILAFMQAGNRITQEVARIKFDCSRLSPRIFELRAKGHDIKTRSITLHSGKRVSEYWIEG